MIRADSQYGGNPVPTGTVTFLFTDIEGSTRLWDRFGSQMEVPLARHDGIVRQTVEALGGHIFKTGGDAFYAAFSTPGLALEAAIKTQEALSLEHWPSDLRISVRIALHTGATEFRQMDYFGAPLNRASRLLAAGHGGQILLSLATSELVRDSLHEGVQLRDLGEHRLKDLVRPERIFQVVSNGLPSDFPPLRTLDQLSNNLPQFSTTFIGREREILEVGSLLENARVVTLTGTGGSGKTRLSLQVAADRIDEFSDGAWLIELAQLTDSSEIAIALATAIGHNEQPGLTVEESLLTHLKSKNLLLILDNCEHIVEGCASLVNRIASRCPEVRVLATSREPLGVPGEQNFRVPSLSVPPPKNPPIACVGEGVVLVSSLLNPSESYVSDLTQYESVRLFIDRALLGNPGFKVTNENAPALAELCMRLDGIPLAIELAAARCRALSLEEINERLSNRFQLLSGGSRSVLPRQKTLRALVDWSYDLLSDSEKGFLIQLAVFAGGFTLDAAERICTAQQDDALTLITSLFDKSLVMIEPTSKGNETRFRLLQTIFDYANERFRESEDMMTVRRAHLQYFHRFSLEASKILNGPLQHAWLTRIDADFDNVRAAIRFCIAEGDQQALGLRICKNLSVFLSIRCHWQEGRQWLERLLILPRNQPETDAVADAYMTLGHLALRQGAYEYAKEQYETSLTHRQGESAPDKTAESLHALAHVAQLEGNLEIAKPLYEECIEIRRIGKDRLALSNSLNNFANVMQGLGDLTLAKELHEDSLAIRREIGNLYCVSMSLQNLGSLAIDLGQYEKARQYLSESLEARDELLEFLGIATIYQCFGGIAYRMNFPKTAARFLGCADALRESIKAPIYGVDVPKQEKAISAVKFMLGESSFEYEWQVGRRLPMSEARALALSDWTD